MNEAELNALRDQMQGRIVHAMFTRFDYSLNLWKSLHTIVYCTLCAMMIFAVGSVYA